LQGDRLTLIGRASDDSYGFICCVFQFPLEPLGKSGLVGVTVRVPRLDEALIDVSLPRRSGASPPAIVRGPLAPHPAPEAKPLRGTISVVDLDSAALGERRSLFIYVPPDIAPGTRLPVIYMADAVTHGYAPILEAAISAGRARPAIIVGISSARGEGTGCVPSLTACTRRNLEYNSGANVGGSGNGSPFHRHLRFVADEVLSYVERNYPASTRREDRIAAGHSSGAVWAFSAAARRPEVFGSVIALSAGGRESVEDAAMVDRVRIYAGAGTFEPYYLAASRARAELARRRLGADVRFREIVSGHSITMWSVMFAEAVEWLLSPSPT